LSNLPAIPLLVMTLTQGQAPPPSQVPTVPPTLNRQCLLSEKAETEALHAIISSHLAQVPGTNAITRDFLQSQIEMFLRDAYRLQFEEGPR
jgi:hypothetical protein